MKINLVSFIVFLILFTFLAKKSLAQKGIEFTLKLSKNEIGLLDPICYEIVIKNTKRKDVKVNRPWMSNGTKKIHLMYKAVDSLEWKHMVTSYGDTEGITVGKNKDNIIIEAKNSISHEFGCLPYYVPTNYYLFEEGNTYDIRAVYTNPIKRKKEIYSNISRMKVVPYTGIEEKAKNWLIEKSDIPPFMYLLVYDNWGIGNFEKRRQIYSTSKRFIKLFPDTEFTPWVKLYLSYLVGIGYDAKGDELVPDIKKARELLNSIEKGSDIFFNEGIKKVENFLLDYEKHLK